MLSGAMTAEHEENAFASQLLLQPPGLTYIRNIRSSFYGSPTHCRTRRVLIELKLPPSHRSMISASYLVALTGFATARRLKIDNYVTSFIDQETGITSEGSIACHDFVRLVEALAKEANDEAFGLHFVEALPPRPAGVFYHIVFNSWSLRDAFRAFARFLGLLTDAFRIRYHEDETTGWRARQLTGENSIPTGVDMSRSEPKNRAEFLRVFGIMPNFAQTENRIGFPLRTLALPLPSANPELFTSATDYGTQLLGLTKFSSSFATAVANYIANALQRGDAGEVRAAAALGVTVRTLQRNLAAEGTSFKTLTEETRKRLARHYLINTNMSLTAIAFLLGYSELSAFSRAARVLLGDTPSNLRKRRRTSTPDGA